MSRFPVCKALLFDLDGTLVDSKRDIAEALNGALAAMGRAPLPLDAVASMIGDGARLLVARALAATSDVPATAELVDRTFLAFQTCYLAAPCVHTTLLPGAPEVLALDRPCALVTNKPRAVTLLLLEKLGIAARFGAVWAGGDGPLKPAPDGVRGAAEALGVQPASAWMIGDGPQDILAGRAAGTFTVAVPGIADRERVIEAAPHVVVASLHELATLVTSSFTGA